ncbi:glycosyl transferase [Zunongwangia sp. SCSIO 43204]|uniref:glycosyltransferase family protein n=1 Tax=Zunongwangia sp. SCSIO 43204 TaxID=2779359 RepID=UPI001CA88B55|nr:glycosyltransferase family protein [Zunongwangia sp. SCSIO 43204]UAB83404.1 glycosyl transferase [Zunongwangia sp. SCSIO 43204]
MKILYAIQGTGNGHLSRALEIIPILQKKGHLDLLVSGTQGDLKLPYDVKYQLKGLSFIFGKKGGVDIWNTYRKNRMKRLYNEIKSIPVKEYDLVINDFEPVTAWACAMAKKNCFGLSHQSAVLHPLAPKPLKEDWLGLKILKQYAPCSFSYGFHFKAFDDRIFTPVIRSEIRQLQPEKLDHYTVYLPSYSDQKLLKLFSSFPQFRFEIFSKHFKKASEIANIVIKPVNNNDFIESLRSCSGVICGAGFETPAEALFLKKKLLVVPMKGQFEQQCNAAMLKTMGITVLKNLKKKHYPKIEKWLLKDEIIEVNFPDETEMIIDKLIAVALQEQNTTVTNTEIV